jgi:hypothetical protein
MGRLNHRLQRLEARYGTPEDISTRAMVEAIERADFEDIDLLYEALERLGLKGLIEIEALYPLLTEDEASALDRLVELGEEVLEEWGY